jgi:DNA-binding response OmpR family regulator
MASVEEVALPDPEERTPTVLLVEDEVLIRMGLSDFLQECGFKVLEASNADEAIAMLEARETPIDVVFSDVRMPGAMDGFALAQWIHGHRPGLPVLLTSGDKRMAETALGLCEKQTLLPKPYDFHIAVARIRALIDGAKKGRA